MDHNQDTKAQEGAVKPTEKPSYTELLARVEQSVREAVQGGVSFKELLNAANRGDPHGRFATIKSETYMGGWGEGTIDKGISR